MSKLIIALDFSDEKSVWRIVDQLNPNQCALKIGSELFAATGKLLIIKLINRGFSVFLDLKFFDIPNTVDRVCRVMADIGVWMLTVHTSGGPAMLEAAKKALLSYGDSKPKIIGVTILTSFSDFILPMVGINNNLSDQVVLLAKLAKSVGLDGVVSSAYEVPMIKSICGLDFLSVTPGIRLVGEQVDDQIRVVTPKLACKLGSDYLVIGRSITSAQDPIKIIENLYAD